jgi:hypothetical protein
MPFLSRTYFTSDGVETSYQFDFPYLLADHVFVLTRAFGTTDWIELDRNTEWEYTSPSIINLIGPVPPTNDEIVIRRQTPNEDLLDRLTAPSTLAVAELNLISTQLLYLIQEALDSGLSFEGNAIGDTIDDYLALARWSYDVCLAGVNVAELGVVVGPAPITIPCTINADAPGSIVNVLPLPVSGEAIFDISTLAGEVLTNVGSITVDSAGATLAFPSTVILAPGEAFVMSCTQEADQNFNIGLALRTLRNLV